MKQISAFFLTVLALAAVGAGAFAKTADHSQFGELQRNFNSPEEVTRTCLECHNLAGQEVMKTSHWLWSKETSKLPGREGETVAVGKRNIVSNLFPGIASNERYCTSCHIGYGWNDANFNFSDPSKIDCLICHEHSGSYVKAANGAGYPSVRETNYASAAQSVGRPDNRNCGQCHFNACGDGSGVKHGDLDGALVQADVVSYDIHMYPYGKKLVCTDCHVTRNHDVKGRLYTTSVDDINRISCERCHTSKPHTQAMFIDESEARDADGHYNILNYKAMLKGREAPENSFKHRLLDSHYDKVSCQACHIDRYAVNHETRMMTDWSKAGEEGAVKTAGNLIPEYMLLGGPTGHVLYGDKIDPSAAPIRLNPVEDAGASGKIWPVKILKGRQLYDSENNIFVIPKLYGEDGYFTTKNWDRAAAAGMRAAGLPFSGKTDWIETELMLPINHGVQTSKAALDCEDCHSRDGRLANVRTAGWVPGRDRSLFLDVVGVLMVLGALAGVAFHGMMRCRASKKRGN